MFWIFAGLWWICVGFLMMTFVAIAVRAIESIDGGRLWLAILLLAVSGKYIFG